MAQDKLFDWYGGDAPAIHGMKADSTVDTVDSYAAEGNVNAGDPVILGTDPAEQVKTATSTQGASVVGVALFTHQDPQQAATYPEGKAVPVMTSGDVFVKVGSAVTAGTGVAIDSLTGGLSYIAKDAAGDTAYRTELPNCTFLDSGSAGDLVKIRIRN